MHAWRTHVNHSVVSSKERKCEIQRDCSGRGIVVRREPGVASCDTERVKACQGNSNRSLSNRKQKQDCAANVHRCAPSWSFAHSEGRGWIAVLRMRIIIHAIDFVRGDFLSATVGILAGISLNHNRFYSCQNRSHP